MTQTKDLTQTPRTPRNFGRDGREGRDGRDRRSGQNYRGRYGDNNDIDTQSARSGASAQLPVEKLLPQNVAAEAAFLGSILIDPEALTRAADWVKPEWFYREAHREIFSAMVATLTVERTFDPAMPDAAPGDLIQTTDMLERRNLLDWVGGVSYVSSLANQVPTSANWTAYANIIERTYTLRMVIQAAGQIAGLAYSDPEPSELRREAPRILNEALRAGGRREMRWFADVLKAVVAEAEARMSNSGSASLCPTGYAGIDQLVGGFEPDELWVIAGRPSSGKSALGQHMLLRMLDGLRKRAEQAHEPIPTGLYVTLEMTAEQQVRRILSSYSRVSSRKMRAGFRGDATGDIDEQATEAFYAAVGETDDRFHHQIAFEDENLDVLRLEEIVNDAVIDHDCRIVLVDQLDLFDSTDSRPGRIDEYALVSHAIRTLKQIARKHHVIVICLAQLNREAEGVRPERTHLRSTGRIEMDADGVILLYRPASSQPDDPFAGDTYRHYAEAWLAKVRGAEDRTMVPLYWVGATTQFADWPTGVPLPILSADTDGGAASEAPSKRMRRQQGGQGGQQAAQSAQGSQS